MRSKKGQYGAEGYIVSMLALVIGLIFLAIAKVNAFIENNMKKRVAVALLAFAAYYLINVYLDIYRIKVTWYSNKFMPPDNYIKGPLWRDQRTNI